MVSTAVPQITGDGACFHHRQAFCLPYGLVDTCSQVFPVCTHSSHRGIGSAGKVAVPRCSPDVCSVQSSLEATSLLYSSGYLTLPFLFLLLDDDHFSPEADAAMSEMTGNAALLAQVCGWGGRLADQPGAVSGASCPLQVSVQVS